MEKAIITSQSSLSKGFHSSPITSNDSNLSRCAFAMWFVQKKWQADVGELDPVAEEERERERDTEREREKELRGIKTLPISNHFQLRLKKTLKADVTRSHRAPRQKS